MDFFGITLYGLQNYVKDILKDDYIEPESKKDVQSLIQNVFLNSKLPKRIQRPDMGVLRIVDCYTGRVDGFAYGSSQRFKKMKLKGVIKFVGPADMYRLPPTSSVECGWWQHDPAITDTSWHVTSPRRPQPTSPYTLILDAVRKNNKYATMF